MNTTLKIMENAKKVKNEVLKLSEQKKNELLNNMAESLIQNQDKILSANDEDVMNAKDKLGSVMIDRLKLTKDRIKAMADGIIEVSKLNDPAFTRS